MLDRSDREPRAVTDDDARSALTEYAPRILAYFLHRVASKEDAADLTSETLLQAWRSRRRMPAAIDEARLWLFGVARNVQRHHWRSIRTRDDLTRRLIETLDQAPAAGADAGLDVRRAVESLPAAQAELIRLVHWDDLTIEDAARLLRIPASTARSRYSRAKELLREALREHPPEPAPSPAYSGGSGHSGGRMQHPRPPEHPSPPEGAPGAVRRHPARFR